MATDGSKQDVQKRAEQAAGLLKLNEIKFLGVVAAFEGETLMFWLGVALFVIAWAVALLVWASCALAKEGDEALHGRAVRALRSSAVLGHDRWRPVEELDESLRRLQQVAASVVRTSGRRAELIHRRAQPTAR